MKTLKQIEALAAKKGVDLSSGDDRYNAPFGTVTSNKFLVITKKNAQDLGLDFYTHWYDPYGSVAHVRVADHA